MIVRYPYRLVVLITTPVMERWYTAILNPKHYHDEAEARRQYHALLTALGWTEAEMEKELLKEVEAGWEKILPKARSKKKLPPYLHLVWSAPQVGSFTTTLQSPPRGQLVPIH